MGTDVYMRLVGTNTFHVWITGIGTTLVQKVLGKMQKIALPKYYENNLNQNSLWRFFFLVWFFFFFSEQQEGFL